jgi:hypothetical protein
MTEDTEVTPKEAEAQGQAREPDLSTLTGFTESLDHAIDVNKLILRAGEVYCAQCGAMRMVDALHVTTTDTNPWEDRTGLFFLTCRQCGSKFTLLRFASASRRRHARIEHPGDLRHPEHKGFRADLPRHALGHRHLSDESSSVAIGAPTRSWR